MTVDGGHDGLVVMRDGDAAEFPQVRSVTL